MTPNRIEEIRAQLLALSNELWDLVQPTKDELDSVISRFTDDGGEMAIAAITDQTAPYGRWNLAEEVIGLREDEKEDGCI